MGVRFACPACKHRLNVKSELAGRRGRCPECGARFRVPVTDQDVAAPLETSDSGSSGTVIENRTGAPGGKEKTGTEPGAAASAAPPETGPPSPAAQGAARRGDVPPPDPFRAAPDASWYVRPQTGGQYGPADTKTMRQWLAEHRIGPHSLVWRDGWPAWRPAAEVFAELAQTEPQATAPTAVPHVGDMAVDRPNPGRAKYRRAQKQTTIVAILVGVAVLLVIALVVAILWPRGSDVQTSRYGSPPEPLHSQHERSVCRRPWPVLPVEFATAVPGPRGVDRGAGVIVCLR